MSLAASPLHERHRVKVYELRDSDWFDRGTGFCTSESVVENGVIIVETEDARDTALLEITIKKDDDYQKQQGTLIVWTDINRVDMALSFEKADGCSAVWDTVQEYQEKLGALPNPSPLDLPHPTLDELERIEQMVKTGATGPAPRDLLVRAVLATNYVKELTPLVWIAEDFESLEHLHRLCNIIKQLILFNDAQIIEQIIEEDTFSGAIGALEYDPDFPNHKANHRQFFEESAKFKEVVQISDPEVRKKIHFTYRLQYLKDVALARVLDDPSFGLINAQIHFNHIDIIQYVSTDLEFLKSLFGIINSGKRSLQERKDAMSFVQHCCQISKPLPVQHRYALYQNFLAAGLFQAINFSLQNKDSGIRISGTDVLIAMIDHDMMMMRNTVHRAANETMLPITDTLIDLFLVETDLGVKAQVADAIKVLLDSSTGPLQGDSDIITARFRASGMTPANRTFLDKHLQPSMHKLFHPLTTLNKKPLPNILPVQQAALLSHLVEILSFFVRQPNSQAKNFILSEGLIPSVARLVSCSDKPLKLSALKFCKTCVVSPDPGEYYQRSLIHNNVFHPIISIISNPRDTLTSSCILDLFEHIRVNFNAHGRYRNLIIHLVDTYRPELEKMIYLPLFAEIIRGYERIMDPTVPLNTPQSRSMTEMDVDSSFMTSTTSEIGSPAHHSQGIVTGGNARWAQGLREDADEDAYFSTQAPDEDDDQDELGREYNNDVNAMTPFRASPLAKPLVEYGDEDEDTTSGEDEDMLQVDAEGDAVLETPPRLRSQKGKRFSSLMDVEASSSSPDVPIMDDTSSPSVKDTSSDTTAPSTPPPPASALVSQLQRPPSVAEKRRREEDDEDELGKLSSSYTSSRAKRRNSSDRASFSSAASEGSWSFVEADDVVVQAATSPEKVGPDVVQEEERDKQEREVPKLNMLRRRPRQDFGNTGGGSGGGSGAAKMTFKIGGRGGDGKEKG